MKFLASNIYIYYGIDDRANAICIICLCLSCIRETIGFRFSPFTFQLRFWLVGYAICFISSYYKESDVTLIEKL